MLRHALAGCFALAASVAWAGSPKLDRYTDRPSVLKVSEAEPEDQDDYFYQAHVEAAALFMALYGKREIYVLARDAEYLYDTLRLLNPKATNLHLLNVSRQHLTKAKAERLRKYLEQEGVSAKAIDKLLASGKSIVLIDTGFAGTIPYFIRKIMYGSGARDGRKGLHTHLLASEVGNVPSLRTFTAFIGLRVGTTPRQAILDTIEHVPHYTSKATDFELVGGRWVPVSEPLNEFVGGNETNIQSRQGALDIMGGVKRYVDSGPGGEIYHGRLSFYEMLLRFCEGNTSAVVIGEELKTTRTRHGWGHLKYAMLDLIEALEADDRAPAAKKLREALVLSEMFKDAAAVEQGLHRETKVRKEEESKKIRFFEANEDVADLVIDPDFSIPAALAKGDFGSILAVLERGYQEVEFVDVLSKSVARYVPARALAVAADEFVEKLRPMDVLQEEHLAKYLQNRGDESALYRAYVAQRLETREFEGMQVLYGETLPDSALIVRTIDGIFRSGDLTEDFTLLFGRSTMGGRRFAKHRGTLLRAIRARVEALGPDEASKYIVALRHALAKPDKDVLGEDDAAETDPLVTILSYAHVLGKAEARQFFLEAVVGETIVPEKLDYAEARRTGYFFDPDQQYLAGDVFLTPGERISMTVLQVERRTEAKTVYLVRAGSGRVFRLTAFSMEDSAEAEMKRAKASTRALARLDKKGFDVVETLESGDRHVVEEYVEGLTGQQWLAEWAADGFPEDGEGYQELLSLIRQLSRMEMMPRDLRAKDLVWDGRSWIFAGSTVFSRDPVSRDEVFGHLLDRVEMWGAALDRCAKALLKETLDALE